MNHLTILLNLMLRIYYQLLEQQKQAYFRINSENMGQFERTLIIADEGASVNYVEGCTVSNLTFLGT
jgi:Fe-S cluster assembly scaffold protein SufB